MNHRSKKWILSVGWFAVAMFLLSLFSILFQHPLDRWLVSLHPSKWELAAYAAVIGLLKISVVFVPLSWIWGSTSRPRLAAAPTQTAIFATPRYRGWIGIGVIAAGFAIIAISIFEREPKDRAITSQALSNVSSPQAPNVEKVWPKPSPAAINWLREADALDKKDKDDYAGQLRIARSFVSRDPTNDFAWSMLGLAYANAGENAKALEAYEEAIKLDRSALAAWEGRARIYIEANDFARAEQALERITELKPEDTDSWEKLGIIYHLRGDRSLSIGVYQKLRTLDPHRAKNFFEAYVVP